MQTFPHLYPNLIDCTKQTLLKDGIARGLYAGTVPSLAANIGENSVLFAAYGGCQKLVASATGVEKTESLGMFANGVSGFLAAFWSSLVPDIIKSIKRLIADPKVPAKARISRQKVIC